jgi:uncharacterized protein DUF3309
MRIAKQAGISTLALVLLVVLILLLLGTFPVWPHAASFGYGPSGILGLLLIVILILAVLGKL